MSSETQAHLVTLTDSAARKVRGLIEEANNMDLMLRAYISGGGCSGFEYNFSFDEVINPDDHLIEKVVTLADGREETVQLLIDAASFSYLEGAVIDYQEDVQGGQFVINNPKAKSTCGCGSSFGID